MIEICRIYWIIYRMDKIGRSPNQSGIVEYTLF